MTLNIHNWTKLQKYFPDTKIEKEELKKILLKTFLNYNKDTRNEDNPAEINTINKLKQ